MDKIIFDFLGCDNDKDRDCVCRETIKLTETRTKTNYSAMTQTCRGQKTAMNLSQEMAERVRTLETTQTTV